MRLIALVTLGLATPAFAQEAPAFDPAAPYEVRSAGSNGVTVVSAGQGYACWLNQDEDSPVATFERCEALVPPGAEVPVFDHEDGFEVMGYTGFDALIVQAGQPYICEVESGDDADVLGACRPVHSKAALSAERYGAGFTGLEDYTQWQVEQADERHGPEAARALVTVLTADEGIVQGGVADAFADAGCTFESAQSDAIASDIGMAVMRVLGISDVPPEAIEDALEDRIDAAVDAMVEAGEIIADRQRATMPGCQPTVAPAISGGFGALGGAQEGPVARARAATPEELEQALIGVFRASGCRLDFTNERAEATRVTREVLAALGIPPGEGDEAVAVAFERLNATFEALAQRGALVLEAPFVRLADCG